MTEKEIKEAPETIDEESPAGLSADGKGDDEDE